MRSFAVVVAAFAAAGLFVVACATEVDRKAGPSIETSQLPPVAAPVAQVDNAYVLASKVALPATKPEDLHGLHNLFRLSSNVISGSEPHGEEALRELAAMGVKTIISVDGKKPEAEIAAKYGMRYVHVPVEYRGLSEEEVAQLVKTYRELEGPFYTHCFHGKHRGPAAAAIGRLVLDGIAREEAIAEMRQWCGTSPEYEGLYRDVATRVIPTVAESKVYFFDFPSARSFGGIREAMIDIARRDDNVKKLSKGDWAVDPAHPDIDPLNEATKLADTFRVTGTMTEVRDLPQDFHDWLQQSAEKSRTLAEQLAAAKTGDAGAREAAKKTYAEIAKLCTACHTAYRNH